MFNVATVVYSEENFFTLNSLKHGYKVDKQMLEAISYEMKLCLISVVSHGKMNEYQLHWQVIKQNRKWNILFTDERLNHIHHILVLRASNLELTQHFHFTRLGSQVYKKICQVSLSTLHKEFIENKQWKLWLIGKHKTSCIFFLLRILKDFYGRIKKIK